MYYVPYILIHLKNSTSASSLNYLPYFQRIKDFDEDTQSEIERLENEIQAIGFIEQ